MLLAQHAPRVLAIGAHPDDIELGMGGCVHYLLANHDAYVDFLVLTEGRLGVPGDGLAQANPRREEAYRGAEQLGVIRHNVVVLDLPEHRLQTVGHETIQEIERRLFDGAGVPRYDVVFTHAAEDTHEDHRAAHEATMAAVRDFHGTVLCYQSPSTKPNGSRPTFFVRLDDCDINHKHEAIMAHVSQHQRLFMNMSRTVSVVANWSIFFRLPPGTYLEAFEVYKSFHSPIRVQNESGHDTAGRAGVRETATLARTRSRANGRHAAGSSVTRSGSDPARAGSPPQE